MQRPKLSDQVAEQLEGMIAAGNLQPGERLPAERQLSERLGISRPSLREAIQKLANKGLLNTRQGGGTFVAENLSNSFSDPLLALVKNQPDAEFDTLEVRKELEGVAAYNAASRATETDRNRIWARFDNMLEVQRSSASGLEKVRVDRGFHLAIVESAHNIILLHFMRTIQDVLENAIHDYLDRFYAETKFLDKICVQHEDIVTAIMDRDPETAREKARNHLTFAYQAFREFKSAASLSRNSELYATLFDRAKDL